MRPTRRFESLASTAMARLTIFRSRALNASLAGSAAARIDLSVVTIELLNLWTNFCRSYYLSCILKPRRVAGGRVVAGSFAGSTFTDAIRVAMTLHKPRVQPLPNGTFDRRHEPTWYDTTVFSTSCAALGCSNLADIQAALSTGTRAFLDLPVFRNFFAHRNAYSAAKVRVVAATHYSIPTIRRHPADVVAARPYGRPVPLLVDWIDDIVTTIQFLCD